MGWLRIIIFFIVDLMVINFILAPTSVAKIGEQWLPSENVEMGRDLDYEVKTYTSRSGLTTSTFRYNIRGGSGNDMLIHGVAPVVEVGVSDNLVETSTERLSVQIIRPERGFAGMMGGEEDFSVNKHSLLAAGTEGPSMAWNAYVYHPSLYSFLENKLGPNNNWFYLSTTDGYAYQVNVLGKDKDTYVVDIEYPTMEKDRLWINLLYPTPVRLERYTKTDDVILSSALMS